MADAIVTRNKAEYVAAVDKLKNDDLRAARRAEREKAQAERKVAVELNKRHRLEPKLISREEYLSKARKKKRPLQAKQATPVRLRRKKTNVVVQPKSKRTKKPKQRSVWTVSGGAFESNRRRH